jgi:hypothetical protein
MDLLASETTFALLEDIATRSPWNWRIIESGTSKVEPGLHLCKGGVERETRVGVWKKEMGVLSPECIIKLRENFGAC